MLVPTAGAMILANDTGGAFSDPENAPPASILQLFFLGLLGFGATAAIMA